MNIDTCQSYIQSNKQGLRVIVIIFAALFIITELFEGNSIFSSILDNENESIVVLINPSDPIDNENGNDIDRYNNKNNYGDIEELSNSGGFLSFLKWHNKLWVSKDTLSNHHHNYMDDDGIGNEEDELRSKDTETEEELDRDPVPDENDNGPEYQSAAPRTYKGDYNAFIPCKKKIQCRKDETKYFLFSPSGGFNNQREIITSALEIGRLLNRTVYIPMAGKHTSLWKAYYNLHGNKDLFPMDRLLDFQAMEQYRGVHVVPLNISVRQFAFKLAKIHGSNIFKTEYNKVESSWKRPDILKYFHDKHSVLYFKGEGMYHNWFPVSHMIKIKRHVLYSPYIREFAVRLRKATFGDQEFNAIHVRQGDFGERAMSASYFLASLHARRQNTKKRPLYIATEPNFDRSFFHPFIQQYNVTFAKDLNKEVVNEFKELFPKGQIRNDMFGIIEQLLCAQAKIFIKNPYSTFSAYIEFTRNMRGFIFPEGATAEEIERANKARGVELGRLKAVQSGDSNHGGDDEENDPKELDEEEDDDDTQNQDPTIESVEKGANSV